MINRELLEAGRGGEYSPRSVSQASARAPGWGGSPRRAFQCITVRSVFPLLDTVSSDCPAASGAGLPEAVTGGTQRTRGSPDPQPFSSSPPCIGSSSRWTPRPVLPGPEPSLSISAHRGPCLSGSETARGWSCSWCFSPLVQRAPAPEALSGDLRGDNHARGGARRLSSSLVLCRDLRIISRLMCRLSADSQWSHVSLHFKIFLMKIVCFSRSVVSDSLRPRL